MKKLALTLGLLLVVSLFLAFVFRTVKGKVREDLSIVPPKTQGPTVTIPVATNEQITKSLFVPYWTLSGRSHDFSGYDRLIYFGVSPTKDGVNRQEQGYTKLVQFLQHSQGEEKYLTLRMIDNSTNLEILKNKTSQKAIISQTLSLAKENGFTGVILDLELSALPFDSLLKQINGFIEEFSDEARGENITFSLTMYGDTFYRVRPFDIKTISKHVDSVYIMAYDFHKAGGNPGPNFPYIGKDTYGYDFQTMLTDFTRYFSPKEITIVYGMFGYDWETNNDGKAVSPGEALSIHQVKQRILDNCQALHCNIHKNVSTGETSIQYLSIDRKTHVVWFESEESVRKKEEFARKVGISHASFWAYSYF